MDILAYFEKSVGPIFNAETPDEAINLLSLSLGAFHFANEMNLFLDEKQKEEIKNMLLELSDYICNKKYPVLD